MKNPNSSSNTVKNCKYKLAKYKEPFKLHADIVIYEELQILAKITIYKTSSFWSIS